MPRYFFDTHDGSCLIPDDEGQELDGMATARAQALDGLGTIAKDAIPLNNLEPIVVTVRDEAGRIVFRAALALQAEEYAASVF